ncbi:MAG: cyclic lactone autoinducer peptide [Clostridia bacterium]|nr:cyclic lactone autoinducer peptide [Clostridia bacterium]
MKSKILKAVAKITEKTILTANKTTCWGWSYQPKAPANIKNFKN